MGRLRARETIGRADPDDARAGGSGVVVAESFVGQCEVGAAVAQKKAADS
jgi:hypothetical protein